MSTELFIKPENETLPEHMAIGFRDETAAAMDDYVAGAAERIDESVTNRVDEADDIEDVRALAADIVADEIVERAAQILNSTDEVDAESVKREMRRREIMSASARRRPNLPDRSSPIRLLSFQGCATRHTAPVLVQFYGQSCTMSMLPIFES